MMIQIANLPKNSSCFLCLNKKRGNSTAGWRKKTNWKGTWDLLALFIHLLLLALKKR